MDFQDERLNEMVIRPMIPDDVPAVTAIDSLEDQDPWTESLFRRELELPMAQALVAIDRQGQGDPIAGFIAYWIVADEVQLHKIVVSRPYRRRGIAGKLFQSMMERTSARGLSRTTLEVRRGNEAAIKFYEMVGYRVIAVRNGYYDRAGEDALIMSAELRPDALIKR